MSEEFQQVSPLEAQNRMDRLRIYCRRQTGLMGFVLDAVEHLDLSSPESPGPADTNMALLKLHLILQVYCYARGQYESTEMEMFAYQSPEMGILFDEEPPSAEEIRAFRRDHTDAIWLALVEIFDLALKVRFGTDTSFATPVDACVVDSLDAWFEPLCGPQADKEADLRLKKAMFWDTLSEAC